ncbi:MAG: type III pantothenate kinase [candidate division WOR-3 bacterium]
MRPNWLLAIDIGNSFTHCGLFREKNLIIEMRWPTREKIKEGNNWFSYLVKKADEVIIASVVAKKGEELKNLIRGNYRKKVYSLKDDLETGLKISYGSKESPLGEDRIAGASAVAFHYRKDGIIVDLGTATTISAVTKEGKFLGGLIAPGILSALSFLKKAERLRPFSSYFLMNRPLRKIPPPYLARDTENGIRNGIYLFLKSFLEGTIKKIKLEMPQRSFTTFLTGGLSFLLSPILEGIDIIDPFLNLRGLCMIYYLNKIRR